MEEYKVIKGYEDYKINKNGKVIRGKKEIKSFVLPNGYSRINLYKDGNAKQLSIHRLVAIEFIGEPPTEKHVVNHKNSIRNDNRVENLEWMTYSENVKYGYTNGFVDREKNKKQLMKSRILANEARRRSMVLIHPDGREEVFNSIKEACNSVGINNNSFNLVVNGKRNHHKGYKGYFL